MYAQACNRHTIYCVPLYDSLGENAIEFIINHSEATLIFASHDKLGALLAALPKVTEWVKQVVYWGPAKEETLQVKILNFLARPTISVEVSCGFDLLCTNSAHRAMGMFY